jgi:hypothetical protein
MSSIANEVSSLESELQSLRADNDVLKHNKAIIEFENESLRRAIAKAQAERDNYMRRSEAIKSLLDQTGASLVAGMNRYHESEREMQRRQLADEQDGDLPLILSGIMNRAKSDEHSQDEIDQRMNGH